jgi:hypothetical protein
MSKLGFRSFTAPTPVVEPTLRQKVVALTDDQRANLLNGFELLIPAAHLDHKLGISLDIIDYVYNGIDAIQESCRSYMRGEILITPAVMDNNTFPPTVITPAVFNTPPTTQAALAIAVRADFLVDFPAPFIVSVVQEVIKMSKYDGTGTFAFYKSQIIL